jgi:hypothetical protein
LLRISTWVATCNAGRAPTPVSGRIFTRIIFRDVGRISTWDTIEKLEQSPLWLPLGMLEGFPLMLLEGSSLGLSLGMLGGSLFGIPLEKLEGSPLGLPLGMLEGFPLGFLEGSPLGIPLGLLEGYLLGLPLGIPFRKGVIALVALASLISSHPHCCRHRKLASAQLPLSPNTSAYMMLLLFSLLLPMALLPCPNAVLASLQVLRWCPCPHRTGANTSIVLLMTPALRRRHCQ